MHVIDDAMELLKELLLLLLNVLILLETHLVLPLQILILFLSFHDFPLLLGKQLSNFVVLDLPLLEPGYIFTDIFERFHNHIIVGVLDCLFSIGLIFADLLVLEVSTQCRDHIHVQACDVVVVIVNVLVLLVVLGFQLLNGLVLLSFDLCDLSLALGLHLLTQARHLRLVLLLDLVGNALVLLTFGGRQRIIVLV